MFIERERDFFPFFSYFFSASSHTWFFSPTLPRVKLMDYTQMPLIRKVKLKRRKDGTATFVEEREKELLGG